MEVLSNSLIFCVRTIPSIFLGIVLVNILENMGWTKRIGWIANPFTRLGRLKEASGISFIVSFGSPSSGNAMLMQLFRENKIDRKEMYVASLANTFPAALMHWRSMLPVLIPLLGVTGILYFATFVLIGFIKTIAVLIVGRVILKGNTELLHVENKPPVKLKPVELLQKSVRQGWPLMRRVIFITVPVTVLIFWLVDIGVFDRITLHIQSVTRFFPIPVEGLSITAAYFGQTVAAYTIAGNMQAAGAITAKNIILALLLGQVLSSVISSFRYSAPYYIGIFGTKMGVELLVYSSGLRILFTIIMFYCIYFFA
ncbi:MAG: hypothetical protein LBL04_12005 [Bacteroidales bacterium]|nr:hypothetical protein [Bacteroidales bacterium]